MIPKVRANRLPPGVATCNALHTIYRGSAKRRQLDFTLTKEEFRSLTSSACYYCGSQPFCVQKPYSGMNGEYIYNGIDRLDSSRGYIADNCVPCCKHCNTAKWNRTHDDFLAWVKQVYDHRKNP